LSTFASVGEVVVTAAASLVAAGLGAWGAIWAGKRAASETAKAEVRRQAAAEKELADTRRAAARIVEVQLGQTLDQFENALTTHKLAPAFDIPTWDDIRVLSPALSEQNWSDIAEAIRWLRYVRTLAMKVATTYEFPTAADGTQIVPTDEIASEIEEAVPYLRDAVAVVSEQAGGLGPAQASPARIRA
jgi:hypothetical protein